jgi:hypothetical protein
MLVLSVEDTKQVNDSANSLNKDDRLNAQQQWR